MATRIIKNAKTGEVTTEDFVFIPEPPPAPPTIAERQQAVDDYIDSLTEPQIVTMKAILEGVDITNKGLLKAAARSKVL